MKKWVYIRCLVRAPDVGAVSLMNALAEKIDGQPRADVIPPVHASSLSFEHVFVDAKDDSEAYAIGGAVMPPIPENDGVMAMNDYVVELPRPAIPAIVRWATGG